MDTAQQFPMPIHPKARFFFASVMIYSRCPCISDAMKEKKDKATHDHSFSKKIFKKFLNADFKNPNHIELVFDMPKYILHEKWKIKLMLLEKTHKNHEKNCKFRILVLKKKGSLE